MRSKIKDGFPLLMWEMKSEVLETFEPLKY
jgi:hypothetical protein